MSLERSFAFPPSYRLVPAEVLAARREAAAQLARREGLAGLLFTYRTDLYHLTGSLAQGALFLPARGEPLFMVRRHPGRSAAESPLPVVAVDGLPAMAGLLTPRLAPGAELGLCLDVMNAKEYLGWQKQLPGRTLRDATRPWLFARGVKDAFELARMAAAGELAARAYAALPAILRPGKSEQAASGEFAALLMAGGHVPVFRNRNPYMELYGLHLLSGPEGVWPSSVDAPVTGLGASPAFPQAAGPKPLRPGEPIVLDSVINLEGYQVDVTRTFCLGPAPARVRAAHACLEEVEAALLAGLRPGAVSGELYERAVAVAEAHGFGEYFAGPPDARVSFVAHGLGLELGVPPYVVKGSRELVRAGETYALELKILLPEGPVGLENTVLVNPAGPPAPLTPAPGGLREL